MSEISTEDLRRFRAETPGISRATARIHLNNAGAALPPEPVLQAALDYLEHEGLTGGYEAADEARERIEAVYGDVAALLGTSARAANVALVENATVAFSQALSAFSFAPGDVLVTTESDYPSNHIMYAALAERAGLEVRVAADLPAGGVDPQAVAEHLRDPRCRLVAVSWVPTSSGLVQRVAEVGEVCVRAGVPYLIDACQAVGQLPIDVAALHCDYLAATARKFLRGPRGLGFLYVSDRALARREFPLGIDMAGAHLVAAGRPGGRALALVDTARRFENWEFSYALVLALGAAARYAAAAGITPCGVRAMALATGLRQRLAALPAACGITVLDRGERLCAIVTAEIAGRDAQTVVRALRRAGLNIHAVDAPRADGSPRQVLRISPHYYNTAEEIDTAVEALRALATGEMAIDA